ncbi:hypothetical protein [Cellulosimicrobium cellulans]|uniref:hypothetical protein n=1 Tax=Cellulosimicrobium cellulans TaxID=1710 RepID=UPI001495AE0F|nr:hypothetical protein [Cellulosimicrobium cellulans]
MVVAAIVLGVLSALSGRVAVGVGVTITAVPALLALLQAARENHGGPGARAG